MSGRNGQSVCLAIAIVPVLDAGAGSEGFTGGRADSQTFRTRDRKSLNPAVVSCIRRLLLQTGRMPLSNTFEVKLRPPNGAHVFEIRTALAPPC